MVIYRPRQQQQSELINTSEQLELRFRYILGISLQQPSLAMRLRKRRIIILADDEITEYAITYLIDQGLRDRQILRAAIHPVLPYISRYR